MKMGPASPGHTGKHAARKSHAAKAKEPDRLTVAADSEDNPQRRLAEAADAARNELIAKAGPQTSLRHKLLASRNRADEIRRRIQSGYYSHPDVLGNIADRLAEDLEP